jgi:hypothetical protein
MGSRLIKIDKRLKELKTVFNVLTIKLSTAKGKLHLLVEST